MNTKLTLRLDDSLITRAKKFSKSEGKSISQIVADYFKAIQRHSGGRRQMIGPTTAKLAGCLKDAKIDENAFKEHLEGKFL
jgi:hypothetical protein